MSSCYKTSDNKHFGCPPRMSDGRHFTDYRPSCAINSVIKEDNKIQSSFQFRNFLQNNAEDLLDINRKYACEKNCCGPCPEEFAGTMLPEKYQVSCDKHTCSRKIINPDGLGDGRKYFTTPQNCADFPSAWPKDQATNQCQSPQDLANYYGYEEQSSSILRNASPFGGNVLGGGDGRVNK